jgi:nucleoside-diphosphate-sugar epimerase
MSDTRYADVPVAITGASGYLGSALREALHRQGADVLLVSRRPLAARRGERVLQADPRAGECWRHIVEFAGVIFHLASNTSVYTAAADPAGSLEATVLPICHLVAASRDAGRTPRVIFASTATVYGLTVRLPVSEQAPPDPMTTYDQHKLFAERELALAASAGTLAPVSFRLSNVYGPSPGSSGAGDRGILNKVLARALRGEEIHVFGGGRYVRDYVFVDDVIEGLLAGGMIAETHARTFNLSSGSGVTVRDAFALAIERAALVTGRPGRLVDVPWPAHAERIEFRNYTADVGALRTATGWRPLVSLADGIDRLVAAEHPAGQQA